MGRKRGKRKKGNSGWKIYCFNIIQTPIIYFSSFLPRYHKLRASFIPDYIAFSSNLATHPLASAPLPCNPLYALFLTYHYRTHPPKWQHSFNLFALIIFTLILHTVICCFFRLCSFIFLFFVFFFPDPENCLRLTRILRVKLSPSGNPVRHASS